MGPLDAVWHLLNFLAPAFGVGFITAGLARLIWRRELRTAGFWRLVAWTVIGCTIGLLAGLVLFGRDGRMAGYAFLVTGGSLALWWAGLRSTQA